LILSTVSQIPSTLAVLTVAKNGLLAQWIELLFIFFTAQLLCTLSLYKYRPQETVNSFLVASLIGQFLIMVASCAIQATSRSNFIADATLIGVLGACQALLVT
jgi:hypothetical protein